MDNGAARLPFEHIVKEKKEKGNSKNYCGGQGEGRKRKHLWRNMQEMLRKVPSVTFQLGVSFQAGWPRSPTDAGLLPPPGAPASGKGRGRGREELAHQERAEMQGQHCFVWFGLVWC